MSNCFCPPFLLRTHQYSADDVIFMTSHAPVRRVCARKRKSWRKYIASQTSGVRTVSQRKQIKRPARNAAIFKILKTIKYYISIDI
jgi:hypothetical protein